MSKRRRLKPVHAAGEDLERRRCIAVLTDLYGRGLFNAVGIFADAIGDDLVVPIAGIIKLAGPPDAYTDRDIADLAARDPLTLARTIAAAQATDRRRSGRPDLAASHDWAGEMLAGVMFVSFAFADGATARDQDRLPAPVQVGDGTQLRPARMPATFADAKVVRLDPQDRESA